MDISRKIVITVAMTAGLTSGALATDLYTAPPAPPMAYDSPDSDWSGFYLGLFGTAATADGDLADPGYFGVGKWVGFNVDTGNIIFGIDVALTYYPTFGGFATPTFNAEVAGRIGFAAGDSAMIFGLAGVGTAMNSAAWGANFPYWVAGAGAEFKFSDNLAFRGEYRFKSLMSPPPAETSHNFLAGLVWYVN